MWFNLQLWLLIRVWTKTGNSDFPWSVPCTRDPPGLLDVSTLSNHCLHSDDGDQSTVYLSWGDRGRFSFPGGSILRPPFEDFTKETQRLWQVGDIGFGMKRTIELRNGMYGRSSARIPVLGSSVTPWHHFRAESSDFLEPHLRSKQWTNWPGVKNVDILRLVLLWMHALNNILSIT